MFGNKKGKTINDLLKEKILEEQTRKELIKSRQIDDNTTIIIEKKSKILAVLLFIVELLKVGFRILLIIIVCILATIGGTVLFNDSLRDLFFTNINF